MKHLLTIAAVACAFTSFAAPQSVRLSKGENIVSACGEIVGIQCMTIGETASVTASVVCSVTETTNAYRTVSVPHTRYDFTITNFDGNAAIATNVLDHFSYADWMRGTTNLIVGAVKPVATNISTQVSDGTRVKATYTKTISIGSGTATDHYLKITPAETQYFFGGRIDVECAKQDSIILLIK